MTFLNGLLLIGAATAAVPLLIHLLNRSRYQIVDWGAMHLLESIIQDNQRRIRFREWLLLLVRCAIPILLALCMARPLLQTHWLGGGSPESRMLFVVVDETLSMGRLDQNAYSAWQRTDQFLERLLQTWNPDAVRWLALGGGIEPFNPADAKHSPLANRLPRRAVIQPADDLMAVLEICEGTPGGPHHVLLVSDFQSHHWDQLSEDTLARCRAARDQLDLPPQLTLVSVSPASPLATAQNSATATLDQNNQASIASDNLALSDLHVTPARVTTAQELRVSVVATHQPAPNSDTPPLNTSTVPPGLFDFELWVNEQRVASQTSPVPQGGSTRIDFRYRIPVNPDTAEALPSTPRHADAFFPVEVRVTHADRFAADNRATTLVARVPPVRAGVVDFASVAANIDTSQLTPADFVTVALSPFASFAPNNAASEKQDPIQTRRIVPGQLNDEGLRDLDVLILTDLPQLTSTQKAALDQFVADGKGLLVFSGPLLEASRSWTNENLWRDGQGWFPVELDVTDNLRTLTSDQTTPQRIRPERYEHPALAPFLADTASSGTAAALGDTLITDWLPTVPANNTAASTPADSLPPSSGQPLLHLDSGSPLLVEGAPRVIWMATSADTRWTNLPLRPGYVPLLQSLVEYLANPTPRPIAPAGRGLTIPLPIAATAAPESRADSAIEVLSPHATAIDFTPRSDDHPTSIIVPQNREVGLYLVRQNSKALTYGLTPRPAEESDQRYLDELALAQLASSLGAAAADDPAAVMSLNEDITTGREIWPWFWWAVLMFLILERLLVWWLGRLA